MLSLLTGAAVSAAEVARELDITQANASYHLRLLESAGLLEIAGEESVRGGRAKKDRRRWVTPAPRLPSRPATRTVSPPRRALAVTTPRRFAERRQGSRSREHLSARPS